MRTVVRIFYLRYVGRTDMYCIGRIRMKIEKRKRRFGVFSLQLIFTVNKNCLFESAHRLHVFYGVIDNGG